MPEHEKDGPKNYIPVDHSLVQGLRGLSESFYRIGGQPPRDMSNLNMVAQMLPAQQRDALVGLLWRVVQDIQTDEILTIRVEGGEQNSS